MPVPQQRYSRFRIAQARPEVVILSGASRIFFRKSYFYDFQTGCSGGESHPQDELSPRNKVEESLSRAFAYPRSTTNSCGAGAAAGTSNLCGVQHADVSRETSRRIAGIGCSLRSASRRTAAAASSSGARNR